MKLQHGTALLYKGHVPLQAGMFITEGYKLRPSIDRVNNHKLDNQDWLGRPAAAVELRYASRAVFDSCSFGHLGGDGLDFVEGCRDGAVLSSTFEDIAMNGLVCGSFSPAGLETHLPYRRRICVRCAADCMSGTASSLMLQTRSGVPVLSLWVTSAA